MTSRHLSAEWRILCARQQSLLTGDMRSRWARVVDTSKHTFTEQRLARLAGVVDALSLRAHSLFLSMQCCGERTQRRGRSRRPCSSSSHRVRRRTWALARELLYTTALRPYIQSRSMRDDDEGDTPGAARAERTPAHWSRSSKSANSAGITSAIDTHFITLP